MYNKTPEALSGVVFYARRSAQRSSAFCARTRAGANLTAANASHFTPAIKPIPARCANPAHLPCHFRK